MYAIRSYYDLVVAMDGAEIGDWRDLVVGLQGKANQQVELVVEREGQRLTIYTVRNNFV